MKRVDFTEMSLTEKGLILIKKGRHLTQIKDGDYLLNLYSIEDFFVEVYYSVFTNKVDKIEVMSDLTRIDQYIENKQKKLHLN